MRIHTDNYRWDINAAARACQLTVRRLTSKRPVDRPRCYSFNLSGSGPIPHGNAYPSATFDEWGMFLSSLYRRDPEMECPNYQSADHFHWATGGRFKMLQPSSQHRRHIWTPSLEFFTFQQQDCRCGAILRHEISTPWQRTVGK